MEPEERIADLEDRIEQLERDQESDTDMTRRDTLKTGAAALGLGGLIGGGAGAAATGTARAGTNQTGTWGSPGDPQDWYVEDVYDGAGNRVASAENGALTGSELQFKRETVTKHNIAAYDGDSLDAKWDNVRSNLTAGEPYVLHIPPGDPSDSATDSEGRWLVNNTLEFTNTENRGWIFAYDSFIDANTNLTHLVNISDSNNKPETVRVYGGEWNAGDYTVTNIFHSDGLADCVFQDLSVNVFGTGSADYGFNITSDQGTSEIRWRNVESNGLNTAVLSLTRGIEGLQDITATNIINNGANSGASTIVELIGEMEAITINKIHDQIGCDNAVRLATNGNGNGNIRRSHFSDIKTNNGIALVTEDTTGGSARKHKGITAVGLVGQNLFSGDTVNLNYIEHSNFSLALDYQPQVVIGADAIDIDVEIQPNAVSPNWIIDSGATRIQLNGVGENAGNPSSTGQWNGNGYEGVVVVDTTNNITYHYRGGSWV